jgi:Chalcone isomerase-like
MLSSTHRRRRLSAARALSALLIMFGASSLARADGRCGGVSLPDRMQAFGLPLVRNGMGIRRATFLNVHVYVAGLYLEKPTRDAEEALKPEHAKLITLRFVRDVDHDEMVGALDEALKQNAGASFAAAHKHMESFERGLPALHEGTQLTLAYRQGHGLEVSADGRVRGVERDDAFANMVFRAWIGPRPPDSDLKKGLLGGACE